MSTYISKATRIYRSFQDKKCETQKKTLILGHRKERDKNIAKISTAYYLPLILNK